MADILYFWWPFWLCWGQNICPWLLFILFLSSNLLLWEKNNLFGDVWSFLSILAAILDFDHFGHFFSKIGRHYPIPGEISV